MTEQFIQDDGDLRKYRTELPNMADDELDPYQYRLYGHYKRRGMCWESVRTTADVTKMSVGQVVDTRNWLCTNGWIEIHEDDHVQGILITLVDRWLENFQRYANCSPHEQHRSPREPKKELIKEVAIPEVDFQFKEYVKAYQRWIGMPTPLILKELNEAVRLYSEAWLVEALELTQTRFVEGKCERPSLAYALGICKNWKDKGYDGKNSAKPAAVVEAQGVEAWLL